MTFVIGQIDEEIELGFGQSDNSLEAHQSKAKDARGCSGDDCHNQDWCSI
jgi:hypothetical protein